MSKELIERLRDIRERFIFQGGSKFANDLADRIEGLERERGELKADAMRYRWLRDNKAKNNTHCWHFQNGPIIPGLLTLDSAIDAVAKGE